MRIATMRRRALPVGLLLFTATTAIACGGASGGGGRQVLVDYNNPNFANIALAYFPDTVTVHQGDTVHFKQAWNGEPHSVTMGTLVETGLGIVNPLLQKYPEGRGAPPEADRQFEAAFKDLPFMMGDNHTIVQPAAQPCFLDTGTLPSDPNKPCPKRTQPAFNGKQAYYSSGFIPYAGNNGNSFDVKLAGDIKPGAYHYYCNFHGPSMQGRVIVKAKGATIPNQSTVDKAALSQAADKTSPVAKALKLATTGPFDLVHAAEIAKFPVSDNQRSKLKATYFAGYSTQDSNGVLANEFLPRTIHAKVGDKVTWAFVGAHTVSFDVPRYFPLLTIAKDGTVKLDTRVDSGGGPHFPKKYPENAGDVFIVDGGTWGGSGFRSSGLTVDTSESQVAGYSLTFTKVGTYQYACLIHPKMVGTVVVK
jgi:plastocyanin